MNIEIRELTTPGQEDDFRQPARLVYADDPIHLQANEPIPETTTPLMAYEDGRPVARCSITTQTHNPSIGTIGWFEALNRPEAVRHLLHTAAEQLKKQKVQRIIGPMNGDTWHPYRLNTGPFGAQPFIKEPWNPPYYPELWEQAGFNPTETYDSFIIRNPKAAADHQQKFYDRCVRHGYLFEPVTAQNFEEMIPLFYALSCRIFSENVLYTPISLDEFRALYSPAKPLFQSGLSWLARAADQTPAGYIFTFPDYTDALKAMRGKSNLPAKLRFLLNRRKAERTCIKTLGTLPEHRNTGLGIALMQLSFANSARLGYRETLMCLMHSANDSRRLGGGQDEPYRTYTLYEFSS
ncbi:MAG: hypothetical protein JXR40_00570 [Pontiellaceae bacterium]|nr:hypothetical protein [Pontiellaceae bacterium]